MEASWEELANQGGTIGFCHLDLVEVEEVVVEADACQGLLLLPSWSHLHVGCKV